MQTPRARHTATVVPNGQVLVVGGVNSSDFPHGDSLTSAELYDPATGIWTPTGSMQTPRVHPTVTLLPNGKVLVAGGSPAADGKFQHATSAAELYDPATGTWTPTGSMQEARTFHTATLLANG